MAIISKILYKIKILERIRQLARKKTVIFDRHSITDLNTQFGGFNLLGKGSKLFQSSIGYASYIGDDTKLINVKIGKYTCVGPRVINVTGRHPTRNFVSIHPAFYSLNKQVGFSYVNKQKFEEFHYVEKKEKISVVIGNDVWIGADVRILEGVSISDGAVIAAGSLVDKDVPEYAVVGGVPAKVIRYRFEQNDIEYLKNLKWWDKEDDWIRDHSELFSNVKNLREMGKY